MEVVSANIGRKRKQKKDKSTLEPRNWSRAERSQRTNETIRWKQVWDLGNEVTHFFCLLVLTTLLRRLKDWNASDEEKQRIGNERKGVERQEIKEQPLLMEIQESEHDYTTKLDQKRPEEQPWKRAPDKRISFQGMRKTKILVRESKETTLKSTTLTSSKTNNPLLINSLTRSKMSPDSTYDKREALALVYNIVQSVML